MVVDCNAPRMGRPSTCALAAAALLLALPAALAAQSTHLELGALRSAHLQSLHALRTNPLESFRAWVRQHSKPYLDDAQELASRFQIWLANLEYVLQYNARHTSHWLGMNSLADLSDDEYRASRLGGFSSSLLAQRRASNRVGPSPFSYANVSLETLPKAVDWRKSNAVSEVKNQQQCGSCWAFATTGAIEGVNAIFSKELVSLSEQELVDCDTEQDQGCNGGLMDNAFEFVIENKGLDTEADYPYRAADGRCDEHKRKRRVVTIDGYEDVPENDEASLKKAAAHQPVAVAIEADQKAFQLYVGGVFSDESCGTSLDHGVLVVGYGQDPKGGTYWVVKNSWGPEWGEQGYIRIKAGVSAREGLCGIAMAASYPTKTTPNPPAPGPEPPGPKPGPPGPSPSPSPPDEPVQCDETSSCPPATTCCCVTDFLSLCLQWGCCPIEDAVCCDDKVHCCPPSTTCDTRSGRCVPAAADSPFQAQPWLTKLPATRNWDALTRWVSRGAKPKAANRCQHAA